MKLNKEFFKVVAKTTLNVVQENGPTILTGVGIAGFVMTVVVVAHEAPKAKDDLDKIMWKQTETAQERVTQLIDKGRVVFPYYWKPLCIGAASAACIIFAQKAQAGRTAAIASAYSVLKAGTDEYQAKVIETIGENKNEAIKDAIMQDRVDANPPMNGLIVDTGTGKTLCMESRSGQYFFADWDWILRRSNLFNQALLSNDYLSSQDWVEDFLLLNEFAAGNREGFNANKDLLVPVARSTLTKENVPVLVVDYRYEPIEDYHKWY